MNAHDLIRTLLFAVHALAAFVLFLGLDGERSDRARFQALERDRFAGFLAITVGPGFDALERGVDLGDELALPVAGPQFDRPVGFRRRAVGEVGMILVGVLESSFNRKYPRWRSFMNGSRSVGR